MTRVAAIAIDAAEWWYLERLLDAGRLPNLARLRARAAEATLRTPAPYRSEMVWARFLSGDEPLEAKEWPTAVGFDPATYAMETKLASAARPFFADLGPSKKVIALDLIHSRPADGVEGLQVVAWGSHSPRWPRTSRPQGLLTEIDRRFGTNPAFGNDFDFGWADADFLRAITDADRVAVGRRFDIARWLMDQQPDWDLFLTCVSEFHSVGHQSWHGADERHPLYGTPQADVAGRCQQEITEAIDAELGKLLDALPADTVVMVFAMHGFKPADDVVALCAAPELFHRLYTGRSCLDQPDTEAWRRQGCPPVVPAPGEHIGAYMTDRFALTPKQRARRGIRKAVGRNTFERVRRLAGKPGFEPLAAMSKPTPPEALEVTQEQLDRMSGGPYYEVAAWYHPSWPSMPAFVLPGFADGHVRINLAGRERDGVVDPDDYKRVCDDVVEELRRCRDARTGAPILGDVVRMRESDPFDPEGAAEDLLLFFEGAPDAIEHPTLGVIGPFPHQRTAAHSNDGFCLVAGPGIERRDLGVREASDLTPTILELIGADARNVRGSAMPVAG